MSTKYRSVSRWLLIAVYLGVVILMLACAGIAVGSSNVDAGTLQIEDGVVEVQAENGDWIPVAGDATFELVGELESADPWTVAGQTFETNESTLIEEGLVVGDLVRVRGIILEDETWVASSIELAEEPTDPIIILIGIVDSIDPWVVNGIELTVTDDTIITGDIIPGMIVRVEILLLPDGTWEVLSIAPLGESTERSGCVTIIATVVSVDGDQIQFSGWPTPVTLEESDQTQGNEENSNTEEGDENENEGGEDTNESGDEDNGNDGGDGETISAGQVVLAVVCISEDGQLVIVLIMVLDTDDNGNGDGGTSVDGEKVLVCHKPDKNGGKTLSISSSAVPAHLGHDDTLGACP